MDFMGAGGGFFAPKIVLCGATFRGCGFDSSCFKKLPVARGGCVIRFRDGERSFWVLVKKLEGPPDIMDALVIFRGTGVRGVLAGVCSL
jgi:hypothetical protein